MDRMKNLTDRERDVLTLITDGLSNKLIADRLSITEHAVKFHVNNINKKIKPKSRAHLAVLAVQSGLVMGPSTPDDVMAAIRESLLHHKGIVGDDAEAIATRAVQRLTGRMSEPGPSQRG